MQPPNTTEICGRPLCRHLALAVERIAKMVAVGKHAVLLGQIGPAAIDQIQTGQPVRLGYFLRAGVLLDGLVKETAALYGGVIGNNRHWLAMHHADARHDPCGVYVAPVLPPSRQRQIALRKAVPGSITRSILSRTKSLPRA